MLSSPSCTSARLGINTTQTQTNSKGTIEFKHCLLTWMNEWENTSLRNCYIPQQCIQLFIIIGLLEKMDSKKTGGGGGVDLVPEHRFLLLGVYGEE